METRPERIRPTLFVPGHLPTLENWRLALLREGLTLERRSLIGSELASPIEVEWVDNPGDGSFGQAFSFGTVSESERNVIETASGALVLSLHADLHTARVPISALIRVLAHCGGLAVRVEESKVGFTIARWLELVDGNDLYQAAVMALCGKFEATSCGMHAFSLPDASVAIDGETDMTEAQRLLAAINRYQIDEDPLLLSGQRFSPDAESPKRVLRRWPDAGYPEGHACAITHSGYGAWAQQVREASLRITWPSCSCQRWWSLCYMPNNVAVNRSPPNRSRRLLRAVTAWRWTTATHRSSNGSAAMPISIPNWPGSNGRFIAEGETRAEVSPDVSSSEHSPSMCGPRRAVGISGGRLIEKRPKA